MCLVTFVLLWKWGLLQKGQVFLIPCVKFSRDVRVQLSIHSLINGTGVQKRLPFVNLKSNIQPIRGYCWKIGHQIRNPSEATAGNLDRKNLSTFEEGSKRVHTEEVNERSGSKHQWI
jgi:hypothetical protein